MIKKFSYLLQDLFSRQLEEYLSTHPQANQNGDVIITALFEVP